MLRLLNSFFFPSSLIFARPNLNSYDFFDLIWVVGITDFVLKFFTIGLKCFVLFLPKILLAFKSRVGSSHSGMSFMIFSCIFDIKSTPLDIIS